MIPKQAGWTIVVLGHWNRMIFAPDWMGRELFDVKEVEMLVPLSPRAPTVFRKRDVAIQVSEELLVLVAQEATLAAMKEAERLVCLVLDKLPHTPVLAVGVNFRFAEKSPPQQLVRLFEFADEPDIFTQGWTIGAKKVVRTLTKDERTLNLTFTYEPAETQIDANFHRDVTSASAAAEAIRGKTEGLHGMLVSLLTSAYNVVLEENTDE
jgi:hypothetical protein